MTPLENTTALFASSGPGNAGLSASARLRLNDIKRTIWLLRPDLRESCKDDYDRFEWWLLLNGTHEYRAIAEAGATVPDEFLMELTEDTIVGSWPPLTRLMAQLWRMRPDLQANFDIRTAEGQQAFAWWLLTEGVRESERLVPVAKAASEALLSVPAEVALPGVQPPITCFMHLIWKMRRDLQDAFDLSKFEEQQRFVRWYFIHGLTELDFSDYLTKEQKQFLNAPDERLPDDTTVPISRLMVMVWQQRSDLQQAFSLDNSAGRAAFLGWFFTHGLSEMQLGDLTDGRDALGIETLIIADRTSENVTMPAINKGHNDLPFGVNLIGHARGQFGIGEDVRMAALAMQAAGIPFSIYNVEPGQDVCQCDNSAETLITDALPYAVNLLCTTGIETARLAAVEGSRLFDGRRTIGYWPWELPEWPNEWHHAYNLVDEVWASSRYTYEAYSKSSPKPVQHLPMAVTVDATLGLNRQDFNLAENRFLFVFSFDVLSSLSRKNPQACVRAFKEAFPLGHEPVGLVVKAMRATADNPVWQKVLLESFVDPRITIINETLSRGAVLDLYRVCDAFISLHRAEGFGRGIAEAMMLGKPVIVTGFSGNMDFTTPGSSALVNHRLRSVSKEEYPFAGGQLWAEPEVAHAAWWMRRLVEDGWLRQRLAEQGQKLTLTTYAPAAVGAGYAAVLGRGSTTLACASGTV